jgi:glycosyltransferase involved in cell wall biosynthesis
MQNEYVIVISTYNRSNGKTPQYLEKSLNSILNQSFKNWDLILIGDKYEPVNELITIVDKFKNLLVDNHLTNKVILLYNHSPERDYIKNKVKLWYCAGAGSMNMGLDYARKNNYKYYLHLDDDDCWNPNHIEEIHRIYSEYKNCIFVNTKSTYRSSSTYLPAVNMAIYQNNLLPKSGSMIHSSFSFRLDVIDFNYKTSINENDITGPADGLMLNAINAFIQKNTQYCSIYNSTLTCRHDIEGESMQY